MPRLSFGRGRFDLVQRLNHLDAFGHVLMVTLAALFTGAVILLGQSAFWADGVSVLTKAVLVAVAVLACSQPRSGLLVLAGLAPFGDIGTPVLGSSMRGSEALVLAGLAGALSRGWWTGRIRRFPLGRIEGAALVFGLVVAASCAEQLWFSQVQRDFPGPFLQDLVLYAGRDYLVVFRGFLMIFNAMLLLEGLAVFLWAMDSCRRDPAFASRLVGVIVISAVGAAALNISSATTDFAKSGAPISQLWGFIARQRWTAYIGDVNAAASFFAMCLIIALCGAAMYRRTAFAWLAAALVIAAALWMTGSRTAILLVAAATVAAAVFWRSTNRRRAFWLTSLLVPIVWVLTAQYFASFRPGGGGAVNIRWMFLGTTLRMLQWQPLFGVGIGQYALWSQHFSSPELLAVYRLENAHDNFAQVAGELGLVGLVSFLWLLATALWQWQRASRTNPIAQPALLGLLVFIFTWLGGHPLLVPEVAYPFWILLAVVAGLSLVSIGHVRSTPAPSLADSAARVGRPGGRPAVVGGLVFALLAISIPSRLDDKAKVLDWTRISYGFYGWEEGPQGNKFRWTSSRAQFFIRADVTRFTMPLRAFPVTPANPMLVSLFINDRLANQFRISDPAWRTVDVVIPRRSTLNYTEIDLRVNRTWVPSDDNPESGDSRRLGVQVGELAVRSLRDPNAGALN